MATAVKGRIRPPTHGTVNGTPAPILSPDVVGLVESAKGICLDVGGGTQKQAGYLGMDHRDVPGVDIHWHWEDLPWPLPSACAHRILLTHVVEFVKPWLIYPMFEEVHRVLRAEGQVLIATTYPGHRYWRDPAHVRAWNEMTAHFWNPAHPSGCWEVHRPSPFMVNLNEWRQNGELQIIMTKVDPAAIPDLLALAAEARKGLR